MKNKTKIISLVMIILLAILMQTIGITYAKYLTTEKRTGGAEVAKWSFKISENGEEKQKIKLADTITGNSGLVDGKIAPGASGTIKLGIDATGSEVNTEYSVKFNNEQNKPDNLVFTYLGTEYNSLSEITNITGSIDYDDDTRTRGIIIQWKWKFETGGTDIEKEANNKIDTENANKITEYTFDVVVTGTQAE